MKTRGKGKVDTGASDYAKDASDLRDPMDDGADGNGYAEDRTDDGVSGRGDGRSGRAGGNRRAGRMARVGNTKGRSDKNITESVEFREVVQGFFEFIEEINKRKKKPKKKEVNEPKLYKPIEEPENRKKVKYEKEPLQAQLNDKELKPDAFSADKSEKNHLYRFNQDVNTNKELLELIKPDEKEPQSIFPNNFIPAQVQEPKPQLRPKEMEITRPKEAPLSKPGYSAPMMDFGSEYSRFLPNGGLQDFSNPLLIKQQQVNKQPTPFGHGNQDMFKDLMQRIQLQNFPEQNPLRNYYVSPYDTYPKMQLDPFNVKSTNDLLNLQFLESLIQKNQPNILGSLLGANQGAAGLFGDLSRDLPYMIQNLALNNQRFGNQSLGAELIQNDPEVINPKSFEGKLGRAATHVAIAYFIYFKTLDPEAMAKSDKSKMDPTYNARMLKEKKYETFPNDASSMVSKLLPSGFENRLAGLGLGGGLPLDYLGATDIQRLLAQGLPDQLREAQIQRLQQEAALLRGEDLSQVRAAFQGKSEPKVEEKDDRLENAKRRSNEYSEAQRVRQQQPQKQQVQPKEEEIIEIKENSDAEQEEAKQAASTKKEEKIEPKDRRSSGSEVKSQNTGNEQKPRAEPQKSKEKVEENISAEDMVEEITELTNPADINKNGNNRKKNVRRPPGKNGEDVVVAPNQGPVTQKVYAAADEVDIPISHNTAKSDAKGSQPAGGIQVISSDDSPPKVQKEQVESKNEGGNKEDKEAKPPAKSE